MKIGIPKEIKNRENRVGMTPSGVDNLIRSGNEILIESNAGLGSGYSDDQYKNVGAKIVNVDVAWSADMVIKVKEPMKEEYKYFRPNLIIYTYMHLAANKELTEELMAKKVTSVAYETMIGPKGGLPLLVPMSEIAGRMSVQVGTHFLEQINGGKGVLIGGVPGVRRGNVTIIGAGSVGFNAAKIAIGMGANVTILDINAQRLAEIEDIFDGKINTLISNTHNIAESVKKSDIVVGAVLIPGAAAPKLVTKEMVASMEPGSVVVDIPIDQGGIFETSTHATTHDNPVYKVNDVIHYTVANIPGAVPKTATEALSSATLPYALQIANKGLIEASNNFTIQSGINTFDGMLTEGAVSESLNIPFHKFTNLSESVKS
ncbi:alanine dehydrogenase [Lactobacillus terrae]|uniref:alanine dehydrogenase n=1 Tax=Lactobacillus terrae TaxID=2269374 RepID=UPI000C1B69D6|nr:alanine dehydrogenase [Lactobacillus terrae]